MSILSSITPDMIRNLTLFFGVVYIIYDGIRLFPILFENRIRNKYFRFAEYLYNSSLRGGLLIVVAFILYYFVLNP